MRGMEATRRNVAIVVGVVAAVGIFGYSQYASASQIGVAVTGSELLEETARGSSYGLELEFENPSLLYLSAGETEFTVRAGGDRIGDGRIEAFVLPAMDRAVVHGTFTAEPGSQDYAEAEDVPEVRIVGVTTYEALFTTIDVPFVYYPTEDQARAFIDRK